MARIARFEEHRYVATRDDMHVYDTDDDAQSEALSERIATENLLDRKQLQSFGPDNLAEARNRGFKAI
jgi:hypothetical protein